MRVNDMYNALCEETKRECRETLATCKRMGNCAPDEWERIVGYYYDRDNRPAEGWFCWWE